MVQTSSSTSTPPKQLPPGGAAKGGGPHHGLRGAASKSYSVVGTCLHRLPAHSSCLWHNTCHLPDCCASTHTYTQASAWERTAQLDDQQLRVIDALAAVVGQRPFPAHVSSSKQS